MPPLKTPISIQLELDEDDEWTAHCSQFAGCTWWASTKREALEMAPQAVAAFYQWLANHGETEALPAPPYAVAATTEARGRWTSDDYFADAIFPADKSPVSSAEIERALRWLGYSRSDLLDLLGGLQDDDLLTLTGPPGTVRTLADMLDHIAGVEWWYLANLGLLPGPRPPGGYRAGGWAAHLSQVRDAVVTRLQQTTDEERQLLRTAASGEAWSLRKVLRRLIWHERYHTKGIHSGLRQAADKES